MSEIDPVVRAFGFIPFLSSLVGPMIWALTGRRYWLIAICVALLFVVGAAGSTWWSLRSGLETGYNGVPPTFLNYLMYYFRGFGAIFIGLSATFWLYGRFGPKN